MTVRQQRDVEGWSGQSDRRWPNTETERRFAAEHREEVPSGSTKVISLISLVKPVYNGISKAVDMLY